MNARRLVLASLASLCALICVFAVGLVSAVAAPVQFAPGQVHTPVGVAVDQATSDVYVADAWEGWVDSFDGSGSLLTSFGQAQFGPEPGRQGQAGPQGVAVDNELSSLSYGDVYVVDEENDRVDKFDSSGRFLLMFGGDVNETTGGDVCVAGEACKTGTKGSADGQFELVYHTSVIAVGPGGRVYVGDRARVQVFEPSGGWRESVSLAGLSSTGTVTALAVDSTGDMFVKIGSLEDNNEGAVPGVREFEPDGTEAGVQFDVGSESVEALALDGSGDVFVADSSGGGRVLEYDAAGNKLASFGSGTAEFASGMAYSSGSSKLYVSGEREDYREVAVWVLPVPVSGPPTIEAGSVTAVPGPRGHASLAGKLNPGGFETTSHFEYVDEADFQASGYTDASSTPDAVVGASLEEQPATADLIGLVAGATYHYRLVATNSKGTATSPEQTFEELPPALIKGPWETNVAATSATLNGEIDPLGASTEYRFEYGTTTSYGQAVSGSVGAGEEYVSVSLHRQELLAGTVYHYRIVTHSEVGTVEGADHTFTTQSAGGKLSLPDGRAWELVSPANKNGALIEPFNGSEIQAASGGGAVSYLASRSLGENPVGNGDGLSQVLSVRGAGGWRSEDISSPQAFPNEGESAANLFSESLDRLFSPDLAMAVVDPKYVSMPLSPEATERTLYLRNNVTGSYLPLVTPADVPPGAEFGGKGEGTSGSFMEFLDATPDLSHVVLASPYILTPEAKQGTCPTGVACFARYNVYEWSAGRLQLVNILPNGETEPGATVGRLFEGARLEEELTAGGVSSDGRRVVWESQSSPTTNSRSERTYVRDMVEEKTVPVDGTFEAMSSDGSRIFSLSGGDLYMLDFDSGTQTDLTTNHAPGGNAGVKDAVLGASEDGSYVYFVATGVLASGGVSGEDNLYVSHDTGGEWKTSFIATLSSQDEKSWFWGQDGPGRSRVSSRVSPDGRYVAFMSNRSLTGYDNLDADSGQPDEEVYLYDAVAARLVCASCDPTGARPVGVLDHSVAGEDGLLADRRSTWVNQWLAGMVPGWDDASKTTVYQPRYLSDSGRLFFDSPDALVPQATNGLMDVYEYEPAGVGGASGCTQGSSTFSERSGGCVSLISSGTSSGESVFFDASDDGDDVFFVTASKLVAADYDTSYDVYDAHVCSVEVPCVSVPVSSPPCTSGDSCKAAPSPQPELFGAAPSATFSGTGNVVEETTKTVVRRKSKAKPKKHVRQKKRKVGKSGRASKAGKSRTGSASRRAER